jgi:hypothetical protein
MTLQYTTASTDTPRRCAALSQTRQQFVRPFAPIVAARRQA